MVVMRWSCGETGVWWRDVRSCGGEMVTMWYCDGGGQVVWWCGGMAVMW